MIGDSRFWWGVAFGVGGVYAYNRWVKPRRASAS